MWTLTASVVKGFWSYFWTNDRFLWLKMGKWWHCNFINVGLILKDSGILCVVIFQGDACISCASVGAAVGDGVAVPGPKGERGDPGPPGEGKPGRNVSILSICSFIYLLLCTMWIAVDHPTCFRFRENQAYQVCRDLSVPKEARFECSFIVFSCL